MIRKFVIEVEIDSDSDCIPSRLYYNVEEFLQSSIENAAEYQWKDKWGHNCSSDIEVKNVKQVKEF